MTLGRPAAIASLAVLGAAFGLGIYTFAYAKGWAYLTNDPKVQRRGQFDLDFVESESSNGFHAPQEATRILSEAIDYFRKGQVSLRPLAAASDRSKAGKSS